MAEQYWFSLVSLYAVRSRHPFSPLPRHSCQVKFITINLTHYIGYRHNYHDTIIEQTNNIPARRCPLAGTLIPTLAFPLLHLFAVIYRVLRNALPKESYILVILVTYQLISAIYRCSMVVPKLGRTCLSTWLPRNSLQIDIHDEHVFSQHNLFKK